MWLLYKSDLLRYRNIRGNCKNSTLFIFEKKRYIYLSIHLVCMFLLIQKNVKTAEPIGPKFCVGPHVTPGKGYEWSKFQKFVFKSFFCFEILKMREKNEIRKLCCFVLYCTKRRCLQIKPQLKVEIKDGRGAPKDSSSLLNFYIFVQNIKGDI